MPHLRIRALAAAVVVLTGPFAGAQERTRPVLPQNQTPKPEDVQAMLAALPDKAAVTPRRPRRVLVLGKALGYVHSSIPLAARTIEEMGRKTGAWSTTITYDPADINEKNLAQYDALFLASTSGPFLDHPEDAAVTAVRRKALLDFVRGGKGLAGIHAATVGYYQSLPAPEAPGPAPPPRSPPPPGPNAFPIQAPATQLGPDRVASTWPEFSRLIGGIFKFHWNDGQVVTVKVDEPDHPLNTAFKGQPPLRVMDETYTFARDIYSRRNVRVLTSVDYAAMSAEDKAKEQYPRPDGDYPLSWIRREGKGRVFYEAHGHNEKVYAIKPVLAHLLYGMQYVLGDLKVDDRPTAAAAPALREQPRPNVVILYADDLGYGDVSSYGATALRTPNIDRLAREGLRFTDAHSPAATCTPSRYALLTGEYAFRKPGTGVLPGDAALVIEAGRTTLPAVFQRAGYATAVVGKWHLGLGGSGGPDWNGAIAPGPREIGFDYSFIMPATGDRVPTVYVENGRVVGLDPADPIRVSYQDRIGEGPTGRTDPDRLKMHPSAGHDQTIVNGISRIGYMSGGRAALWTDEEMADTFTRRAVRFLEEHRSEPFFLYFATHDPHVPRVPHPRFAGTTGLGPRGDAIAELDACVGEIVAALDRLGLASNTLVVFTSDNGPVVDDGYRDEAVTRLGRHRPAGPLRGGKYSKFEAGTRVPFIVRFPGRVTPGTSSALVSQVDFVASFAAWLGRPLARGDAPDSEDLMAALLGAARAGRKTLVEQAGGLALREGTWKYIEPSEGRAVNEETKTELGNAPAPQLYDLAADLGETRNLAPAHPDRVAQMQERLRQIRARTAPRD
jgi:arylsulfatase A-like enzyme/type 1 glutamine amidotransferase